MSLLGWTSSRRANKERSRVLKDIAAREKAALGELDPQALQALISMFLSKYMGVLAPQMIGAQQGLRASAGRSGLSGSGLMAQLQAGIPGQFANMALSKAIPSALDIGSQRADIRANRPIPFMPKKNTFADIASMVASFYGMQSPEAQNMRGPSSIF